MAEWKNNRSLWHVDRPMGLSRALAKAGFGSRKQTRMMIEAGRVAVDGAIEVDPSATVTPEHVVALDGTPLYVVPRRYFAFHKPLRVTNDSSDNGSDQLVRDFLPEGIPGLVTAGRLDAATSGLMLVSNDCAWNNMATSVTSLETDYRIQVTGKIGDMEIGIISAGMHLPNLGFIRPVAVEILDTSDKHTWVRLTVIGARNRQVRRIFHELRHDVVFLRRERIGMITLGELASGQLRPLTGAEIENIRQCYFMNQGQPDPV